MSTDLENDIAEPRGIGGWLILPVVGLGMTIYGFFEEFHRSTLALIGPGLWNVFVTPGTDFYHSPWVLVIVGNAILEVAILSIAVIALLSIWKKKKTVPLIMICFYVLALCFTSLNTLLAYFFLAKVSPDLAGQITPDVIRKEIGVIIVASIFIPYFVKSKRVINTFTK